jgi:hypothetical protein
MPKTCIASGTIAEGDAVCVLDFDGGADLPTVARASARNLKASKTVFGVARESKTNEPILINVGGEIIEAAIDTSLAAGAGLGTSRLIVTDVTKPDDAPHLQCRLKRIDSPTATPEGFVVGTCDENGNLVVQPRHNSDETAFPKVYNLLAYGAISNWLGDGIAPLASPLDVGGVAGTANVNAFKAALAAMRASGKSRGSKLVAEGRFYFSEGLVFEQTVFIEGTGPGEPSVGGAAVDRSDAGTMFVFPGNTTGIRIHSTDKDDDGRGVGGFQSGERTTLRNLIIYCKDPPDRVPGNISGDGVRATAPFFMQDVVIESFARHAVFGSGSSLTKTSGNIDGSVLINVKVSGSGVDGFHLTGADATGCVVMGCEADACRRYGFFDQTRMNTYVGCIAQNNAALGLQPPLEPPVDGAEFGSNYHTEGSTLSSATYNSSSFIGCYNEGNTLGRENRMFGLVNIIGGSLGGTYIHPDSTCFVLSAGVATQAPVAYFNDRGRRGKFKDNPAWKTIDAERSLVIQFSVGTQNGNALEAFQWSVMDYDPAMIPLQLAPEDQPAPPADPIVFPWPDPVVNDYSTLLYTDKADSAAYRWWTLENVGYYRQVMRFPTTASNARHPAPWFTNGLFIGRDDTVQPLPLHFTAAPSPPAAQYSGLAQTYEIGDVVWNSSPTPGGPLGQICTTPGTQGGPRSIATTGTIAKGSTSLTLVDATGFAALQYITIVGLTPTFRILALTGTTATLDLAAPAAADAAVIVARTTGSILMGQDTLTLTDATYFAKDQYITIADLTAIFQIKALAGNIATLDGLAAANASGAVNVVIVASTTNGVATFTVDDASGLLVGQRVTIAGVTNGPLKLTQIQGKTITSDPAPNNTGSLEVVGFSNAAFTLFGTIHTRGEDAGQFSIDMVDGDQELAAADVYSATIIKATSGPPFTADHTLLFPAPARDEDSYQRTVRSMVGVLGGFNLLVDVVGGAAPVTIPATQTAIVGFDASGAYLVSSHA